MPVQSHVVTLKTAEAVKYAINSWRAVKVTFANEIGNIAKACGVDGQQVMKLICSDTKVNISPYFMKPGLCLRRLVPAQGRAGAAASRPVRRASPLRCSSPCVVDGNAAQIDRAETMVDRLRRHDPSVWSASPSSRAPTTCAKARWPSSPAG